MTWFNYFHVNMYLIHQKEFLFIVLQVMKRDSTLMRQDGPTIFAQAKHMKGIEEIASLILGASREAMGSS